MADTTTTLNPGSGGDKMDESSVLQSDGVTSAKRPRVVIGSDDGRLYDPLQGQATLEAILLELRTLNCQINFLLTHSGASVGLDQAYALVKDVF